MSINRVNISGNLTRDPEMRVTAGGMQVMGFGVAVNDRRKNQQTGEWEDYPNFVDCTMFGTRAEAVARYLSKGSKVAIDGKLRYSSWEHEGQKRSKLEVIVDEIEFLSRDQAQQPQAFQQPAQGQQPQQQAYRQQPQQQFAVVEPSAQRVLDASFNQARMASVVNPALAQPELYDEDVPF